jgi:colicin import membrane protein
LGWLPKKAADGWLRAVMNGSKTTAWIGAILVHIALVAVLIFSVRWKQVAPATEAPLSAELVTRSVAPPVVVEAAAPPPAPEPPPPPPTPLKPAPAPPVAKALPPAPPVPSPADIAREKVQKENEKKAQLAKLADDAAKEKAKLDAAKKEAAKKQDDSRAKELKLAQDKANKEQQTAQANSAAAVEKQARELAERQAAERAVKAAADAAAAATARARAKAEGDYVGKIRVKVKGNINDVGVTGNPEAVFEVVQLPTGEVLTVTLKKSSGNKAYDEAVERAIQKSSPLPKPDQADLFQRVLTLKFRPVE